MPLIGEQAAATLTLPATVQVGAQAISYPPRRMQGLSLGQSASGGGVAPPAAVVPATRAAVLTRVATATVPAR